jgi:hypothetical protein
MNYQDLQMQVDRFCWFYVFVERLIDSLLILGLFKLPPFFIYYKLEHKLMYHRCFMILYLT